MTFVDPTGELFWFPIIAALAIRLAPVVIGAVTAAASRYPQWSTAAQQVATNAQRLAPAVRRVQELRFTGHIIPNHAAWGSAANKSHFFGHYFRDQAATRSLIEGATRYGSTWTKIQPWSHLSGSRGTTVVNPLSVPLLRGQDLRRQVHAMGNIRVAGQLSLDNVSRLASGHTLSNSSDPSPFTPDFERIRGLISSRSTGAWPALTEFVASSASGMETLWLLEEFIYQFAPDYVDEMAAQADADPKFAVAIAGVTPLDGGPELDAFLALQRKVRVRLGLAE